MLSLAAISAGYGPFRVLSNVSIEVPQGEAVGVIGPNGAGKTTLMRVISGLIQFYTGAMTLEGRSISGLRGRGGISPNSWTAYTNCFRGSKTDANNPPERFPAASSRCARSAARSCRIPKYS